MGLATRRAASAYVAGTWSTKPSHQASRRCSLFSRCFPIPPVRRALALAGFMALTPAVPGLVAAQSPAERMADGRALEAEGRKAAEEGDVAGYRNAMGEAYRLRPGHQTLLYHWARGYAATDSTERAVELLERYAAMGLGGGIAEDDAFAPVGRSPRGAAALGRIRQNDEPAGEARVVFRHAMQAFMPEGVAYDPVDGVYFLGSVRRNRIDRIGNGTAELFADASSGVLWRDRKSVV